MTKIGIIAGSLRKESYSKKVSKYLGKLLPEGYSAEAIDISGLPMYDEDIDMDSPPQEYMAFRRKIAEMDAFLFVTPEYNRSIPAALKNALDVASRPYGQNVWDGKPAAIVSVSPSKMGAFGANHHLRQVMVFLNIPLMQQPEMYLGEINQLFDDNGKIVNVSTDQYLKQCMDSYIKWIDRFV